MCGFAGFVGPPQASPGALAVLDRMAAALVRRGPDEQGVWLETDGTVGLAHRRLAVVGLGPDGRQPMAAGGGRWTIVYNGEIYNHKALRSELARTGIGFRGNSDTEVILAAVETWGLAASLDRFVGMFAFALWDGRERVLHLARDRFGEKPLYFGWQGGAFLFASDLAALRAHPEWRGGIDGVALAHYVRHNCVPAPWSIHPGIRKLRPGMRLSLSWDGRRWIESETPYWSALAAAGRAAGKPFRGTGAEAEEQLHGLLREAVAGQMEAEVPLGAFLSGGIDSTSVVALMQSLSSRPVRTFTIGFADAGYDESGFARQVAEFLGTAHTSRVLGADDALAIIPRLPAMFSEPFADASQIPTALVSRVAREEVTVALSGDGGDEVFGGYNRYVVAGPLWRRMRAVPRILRAAAGHGLTALAPASWDRLAAWLPGTGVRQPGEKLHKLAAALGADSPRDLHGRLASFWLDAMPVRGAAVTADDMAQDPWAAPFGVAEQMMLADTLGYLPDDILVKVDRAAMGFSLETRAPFLDHRLFEFMWSLPLACRVDGGVGKVLLRRLLRRYVPDRLVERPKAGFALPIHDWLRGPLRDWAESLLAEARLRQEGHFDPVVVRRAWLEHLSGRRNRQYDLWGILMFQAWLEHQQAQPKPGQWGTP